MNNATDIQAIRNKCAKQDMAAARRYGELLIGQTKEGLVALRYTSGVYSLVRQGINAAELAKGAPRIVAPVLASLYIVEA